MPLTHAVSTPSLRKLWNCSNRVAADALHSGIGADLKVLLGEAMEPIRPVERLRCMPRFTVVRCAPGMALPLRQSTL